MENNHEGNKIKIIFEKTYFQYDILKNYTILEWLLSENLLPEWTTYIILINNHHIVTTDTLLNDIYNKLQTNIFIIELIPKIHGGGLLDMFMSIIQIGKVFLIIGDIIIWFGKFVAWFFFFLKWLFKFLFYDLIFDFYNSIVIIIVTIFTLPFQIGSAFFAFGINSFGGWMTSIFGWDQTNLTKNDRNSNYFKSIDRTKGKKCYLTNSNTVPFSILLGTIICPPLGVFMDLGVSGWFNILICLCLTLLFYFPGLFYALVIIYS
jgi:uncharacterized membrane protein YqaE (UPF0057 family)